MAAKKKTVPEGNEIILDPESGDIIEKSTSRAKSASSFVPLSTKGTPIEQSRGKGRKQCPSCNLFVAARSEVCPNPDCNHEFDGKALKAQGTRTPITVKPLTTPSEISETAFVKVIAGKGFKYVHLVNTLTGEVVKEEKDPKIEKLDLQFSAIPRNSDGAIHVTQTSPEIQITMNLEKFLELAGIKA
jgi:hypothetical protein